MKRLLIPCLLMFACLKPVDESAFTAGRFATYYVAKTGNDSNPGTKHKPWLTINRAVTQVQAGDLVLVGDGIYVENVNFNGAAGTAAAPIVFRSRDGWNSIVRGYVYFNSKHYTLDGFRVSHDSSDVAQAVKFYADSCVLRGCEIAPTVLHSSQACGVLVGSGPRRGIVIDGNSVHGFGRDGHGHGIYASGIDLTVTHNEVYDNERYNIHAWPDFDSGEIAYNRCYDAYAGAGIIISGHDSRVHHNLCYHHRNGGGGIGIYLPQGNVYGIEVANNTCYDNAVAGVFVYTLSDLPNLVRNNVLLNNGTALFWYAGRLTADHNCYYPDGSVAFFWPGGHGNYAAYRAATSQDSHGICINPQFADTVARDFHLQAGSPCLFAGDPATPPGVDFYGNPTPAPGQTRVSMGAVEWVNPLADSRKAKNIR